MAVRQNSGRGSSADLPAIGTGAFSDRMQNRQNDIGSMEQYDRGDGLFITLDYKSRTPLCDQLCESVIRLAACGAMAPGDQLPSVRSLAQELGINPNTVQKSYRILETQGIIESIPGKGSFLSRRDTARDRLRATGIQALEEGIQTALDRGVTSAEIMERCEAYLKQKEGQSDD